MNETPIIHGLIVAWGTYMKRNVYAPDKVFLLPDEFKALVREVEGISGMRFDDCITGSNVYGMSIVVVEPSTPFDSRVGR